MNAKRPETDDFYIIRDNYGGKTSRTYALNNRISNLDVP